MFMLPIGARLALCQRHVIHICRHCQPEKCTMMHWRAAGASRNAIVLQIDSSSSTTTKHAVHNYSYNNLQHPCPI